MAKPRIYLHRAGHWYSLFMDATNEGRLSSFAEVVSEHGRETPIPPSELVDKLRGCSAILSLNGYGAGEITPSVLRAARSVRVICLAHYWGQFSWLPKDLDITVIEGSQAGTVAVAEWVVAAALSGIRQLHVFDRRLKEGSLWGEPRRGVVTLAGCTASLLGLGRTGQLAARYLGALGVNVIAYSRSCSHADAEKLGVRLVSLEEALTMADVLSLHHRVDKETRGFLIADHLALLKNGAVFINSARAALYDESALIRELSTGRFSAYLDVFASEPLASDHPFRSMDNVVITPHIAGNNSAMFLRCGRDAIETLRAYLT